MNEKEVYEKIINESLKIAKTDSFAGITMRRILKSIIEEAKNDRKRQRKYKA